jgi:integrase
MSRDQLEAFLATVLDKMLWFYAFFLTLARTGMRLGEARALRWEDLDLEGRTTRIARTVADDSRKIGTPKSGHARTVDPSPQLVDALRRLKVQRDSDTLRNGGTMQPVGLPEQPRRRPRLGQGTVGVQAGTPCGPPSGALLATLAAALFFLDSR